MKIVAFHAKDGPRLGILTSADVIDLSAVDPTAPRDLKDVIENNQIMALNEIAQKAKAEHRLDYEALNFDIPVKNAGKILCLGLNYIDHVNEGIFEKQPYPTIFTRSYTSLTPHNSPLIRPLASVQLDYEAELALVIGKTCKHLTAETALDAVAGYTCSNDGSVREFQRHTVQWTMGKNFDQTGSIGPVFLTPDELPDGATDLKIECRLNGSVVQSSNTNMMMFPVIETLVYLTQGITLQPGDIILMGTPSGVGHARTPQLWMKQGDIVEVEIERVGVLRNTVEDEQ
jgi:acylpyruvate hydrolase